MLDTWVYVPDLLLHSNANVYLLDHMIYAEICCCFTFDSCPMNIRFMIAPPFLHWTVTSSRSYRYGNSQCDCYGDGN